MFISLCVVFVCVGIAQCNNSDVKGGLTDHEKILRLESENEQLRNDWKKMRTDVDHVMEENVRLRSTCAENTEKISDIVEDVNYLKNATKQLMETPFVAFSVTTTESATYQSNEVIRFPNVMTNQHPGFPGWNENLNIFTCPYDGFYLFTVTLFKYSSPDANNYNHWVWLRMSGGVEDVLLMYNHSTDQSEAFFSGTMVAIVPCRLSQNVWLSVYGATATLYDWPGYHHNTFSGMLLKATELP